MRELYEKVEFILNGGALNHLSDLLSAEVSSALIVMRSVLPFGKRRWP